MMPSLRNQDFLLGPYFHTDFVTFSLLISKPLKIKEDERTGFRSNGTQTISLVFVTYFSLERR